MIPLFAPDMSPEEQSAMQQCLESGWISSAAPQVAEFERALADYTGSPHVVAVQSGTAALHLALLVHGIGPGDEVLLPTLTFIATANAVRYTGATVVLVDAEPDTWQMDPALVEEYLANENHAVKAILLVHVLGYLADVTVWEDIAERHGLVLIEDAAGAIGSRLGDRHAGSIAECGILSFNGNKLVTTGGGGAVLCQYADVAARVRHLANQAKLPGPGYDHDLVGYNYRMSGLGAVLGLVQLQRLPDFLDRHRHLHEFYQELFPEAIFPKPVEDSSPNHWLITARMANRDQIQAIFDGADIQTRPFWTPMHLQLPYAEDRYLSHHNHSETIWQEALSFPSGSGLTDRELDTIREVIVRAR